MEGRSMTRRSLLVIVVLTLVLAAPTGAAVSKLITGKQIASGAIQPRHLSAGTRSLGWLHKKRIYGFVTFSYTSPGPKTIGVQCLNGTTLLAGGFSASSDLNVTESAPTASGNGWEATGKYVGGDILAALYAYALCVS